MIVQVVAKPQAGIFNKHKSYKTWNTFTVGKDTAYELLDECSKFYYIPEKYLTVLEGQ